MNIRRFVPKFIINQYHFILALLGAVFCRFPSKKLKVIGVTGTNGKSTVVEMIFKTLEEAGCEVASLSSIEFKIKNKNWPNVLKMTMPGRFEIQRFLRQAVNSGCQYAVLEVTSEGIKQHRHRFIDFEAAVFTNLTPEHIESHGGFENYKKAKGELFRATKKIHIINADDRNAEYFLQFPAEKKYTYGLKNGDVKNENIQLKLELIGEFNLYNALAAICVGLSQGIDLKICKRSVEKIKGIPGRMEEIISQPFKVFVDYAVTPDALESLYQTIKKRFNPQKIIAVFGSCGGGRDKWRRPVLGEIAARHCQKIIITNEDPYDEDPGRILSEIKSGIFKSPVCAGKPFSKSDFYEILGRREAIRKSLEIAGPGDIVLITGKGCEPWICLAGGEKMPWDDRKVVQEEFGAMKNKGKF